MADVLTQKQIDKLLDDIKQGELPVKLKSRRYICKYCKSIILFKMEGGIDINKLFLNGCKRNDTGHLYYSKEYLLELRKLK